MSSTNTALSNCEDFLFCLRVLGSISHTLANTGYYSFFKVFSFDEQQLLYLIIFKINVMQDKFLIFRDFILLISFLDFVNV